MAEVLARYADCKGQTLGSVKTLAYSIQSLAPFWGNLPCDAVKGSTCRLYERERAKPRSSTTTTGTGRSVTRGHRAGSSTARRELGVLQAALNHAHSEGLLIHPIAVSLPNAGQTRDRWLTRSEAARLLRHAEPHVRRFILLSLYTGRRATAILDLTWTRVAVEAGTIRFRADGQAETNKRRGRIRIPRRLRAHLARWQKHRGIHVIMFRGAAVARIKAGIRRAAERAGIEGVPPMS